MIMTKTNFNNRKHNNYYEIKNNNNFGKWLLSTVITAWITFVVKYFIFKK